MRSSDVWIFFGNRDGTFTPASQDYASENDNHPTAIASADLDDDGKSDLVMANLGESGTPNPGDDSVAVLLNTGNGRDNTFAAPVTYDAGDGPRAVTIADFDGDGHPDFAVPYQNETANPILSSSSITATAPSSLARTSPAG